MKAVTVILGVLTTILGIFCIFRPGLTALSLGWLLGILLIVSGFTITVNYFGKKIGSGWDAFFGILSIIAGIFLICNYYGAFFADTIIVYIIAGFVLVSGIVRIGAAAKLKGSGNPWVWSMIGGILSVAIAVITMFHPLVGLFFVGYMIAFTIMIQGINTLILALGSK